MAKKEQELIRVNVLIEREQREWLDRHPGVNLSGVVREAIERLRKKINGEA
jgi:post-segregation antitoxin (ccd killing protein)